MVKNWASCLYSTHSASSKVHSLLECPIFHFQHFSSPWPKKIKQGENEYHCVTPGVWELGSLLQPPPSGSPASGSGPTSFLSVITSTNCSSSHISPSLAILLNPLHHRSPQPLTTPHHHKHQSVKCLTTWITSNFLLLNCCPKNSLKNLHWIKNAAVSGTRN